MGKLTAPMYQNATGVSNILPAPRVLMCNPALGVRANNRESCETNCSADGAVEFEKRLAVLAMRTIGMKN